MTKTSEDKPKLQPVDRARRYTLVRGIVTYCLVITTFTTIAVEAGFISGQATLAKVLVEGLLGLAMATTLAYLGASSVDYNGGLGNMFSKNNNTYSRSSSNQRMG